MSCIVTFVKDYFPSTGSGYAGQEQAAFPLDQAVMLVARGIATFSDPADLEANRAAVEIARRARPTPWPQRPAGSRRW